MGPIGHRADDLIFMDAIRLLTTLHLLVCCHSGLSLLHYCCLYNLFPLVPLLASRKGSVNRYVGGGATCTSRLTHHGTIRVLVLKVGCQLYTCPLKFYGFENDQTRERGRGASVENGNAMWHINYSDRPCINNQFYICFRRTACGTTALHLAAGAGHKYIVQVNQLVLSPHSKHLDYSIASHRQLWLLHFHPLSLYSFAS